MGSAEEAGGRHVDLRRAASAGVLQAEDRAHAAAEALQQHRADQQQQQPAARALPGWSTRLIDYFVVCGLGAEVRTMDGQRGFHGVTARDGDPMLYQPQMTPLDFYPPKEHKKFGVPEGLPMVRRSRPPPPAHVARQSLPALRAPSPLAPSLAVGMGWLPVVPLVMSQPPPPSHPFPHSFPFPFPPFPASVSPALPPSLPSFEP
ncbi:unnamed protein product, partial [Closterium sp. NIES-65]